MMHTTFYESTPKTHNSKAREWDFPVCATCTVFSILAFDITDLILKFMSQTSFISISLDEAIIVVQCRFHSGYITRKMLAR